MATKLTKEFDALARQLLSNKGKHSMTVRELLDIFGQAKRGREVTRFIKYKLWYYGLESVPDFNSTHMDSKVSIQARQDGKGGAGKRYETTGDTAPSKVLSEVQIEKELETAEEIAPLVTVGSVFPPNRVMHTVRASDPQSKVITLLMMESLSHVAVMQSPRKAEGWVTWKSIGMAVASGRTIRNVADCMEHNPRVVRISTPLLKAIEEVLQFGAIFLEAEDKTIIGIFTSDDVAKQFIASAQPFMILEEIENRLRKLIRQLKLSEDEMREFVDPHDEKRKAKVCQVDDLTFGEYARAMQTEKTWPRFNIQLDRALFCLKLDKIREIRNSVMHFHPDGISADERRTLIGFRDLLQQL